MKKLIILDANILIRALLGKQVPYLLNKYGSNIEIYLDE